MLYDISLRITYRYEHPANAGRHLLRVMPADLPGEQRRLSGTLDVSPTCGQQLGFRDFFGNEVLRLSLASAHDELAITVKARVDRTTRAPRVDTSPPFDALGDVVARELTLAGTSPHHFVIPSARVPLSSMLRDFAQACIPENVTTLRAVHALGEALHEELIFDADATTVDTPAEEAFIARRGVCQDFAHIMIGVVRPTAAFVKAYQTAHPGTQLFSISVVNGRELHQLAGGDAARGVGITQVMPSPFSGVTRIARDYHQALKRFAPEDTPSYTSFEEYVGARVLIEAIRRSKGTPTPAAVMQSLEGLDLDLGGFKVRFGPGERVGSRYVEVTLLGRDGNHVR